MKNQFYVMQWDGTNYRPFTQLPKYHFDTQEEAGAAIVEFAKNHPSNPAVQYTLSVQMMITF